MIHTIPHQAAIFRVGSWYCAYLWFGETQKPSVNKQHSCSRVVSAREMISCRICVSLKLGVNKPQSCWHVASCSDIMWSADDTTDHCYIMICWRATTFLGEIIRMYFIADNLCYDKSFWGKRRHRGFKECARRDRYVEAPENACHVSRTLWKIGCHIPWANVVVETLMANLKHHQGANVCDNKQCSAKWEKLRKICMCCTSPLSAVVMWIKHVYWPCRFQNRHSLGPSGEDSSVIINVHRHYENHRVFFEGRK